MTEPDDALEVLEADALDLDNVDPDPVALAAAGWREDNATGTDAP